MDISENIRAIMRREGVNQTAIADRMGISTATVSNFLNGGDIRLSTLERIASALAVDVRDFFSDQAETQKEKPSVVVDGYISVNGFIQKVVSPDDLAQILRQVTALQAQSSRD